METIEPAFLSAELLDRDDGTEPVQIVPPVVAVVVTNNPGPWLEESLQSLAQQDYSSLSVLVLDNGSTEDPTARIAAAMPKAFVRRRQSDEGFAAAANDALETIEGATFLLFCQDDVVFDTDSVRVMVEEAYRSNAGIVGPKVVDRDRPEILLEVGMGVDHYAVPYSGIEPEEVDQEQHDGVRDVFYVSHTALLVRTDLFHELSGFDAATYPGADDVDLCWRARLAGARVIVAPSARVRHRPETVIESHSRRVQPAAEVRAATRSRVRVLYKSYSAVALLWILPTAFILSLAEAVTALFSGHFSQSRAMIAGWFSAFRHPGELRRARRATQGLRRVDDGEVRDLMIRGSARLRTYVAQHVHASDRLADVSTRTRVRVSEASTKFRRAPAVLAVILGVLILFGSRSLLFAHVPEVGAFRAWPGIGDAWSTFTASWRTTMMGAPRAATPAFGLIAFVNTVLLGHRDLARSLVVGGALPLGAFGAYRLVRPFAMSALPAVTAAIAYAANPVIRNAIWRGELGPLLCFAFAPFVFSAVVRATADGAETKARVHGALTIALLGAIAGAVWPPALLLAIAIAIAVGLGIPFVGGSAEAVRAFAIAGAGTALAVVLLAPWTFSLIGADATTFGAQPRALLTLADVLHFHTGRAGAGLAAWGILAAAIVPLAIATGDRLAWATRAWILAVLSFLAAWLPSRLSADHFTIAPEGLLVGAALGLAFAAGIGVAAVLDDLRTFHFGWRQVMMVVAVVGLSWATLGFAADTFSGRFGLKENDWAATYSWMHDNPPPGGFRVLWVGDPTILPADAKVANGVGFALTRDGAGDARALWAAPEQDADRVLARAMDAARTGSTSRLGHLLAPTGVRYIAFVRRAAPDSGPRGGDQTSVSDALARQLDLTMSRSDDNSIVYQNDAWVPSHALVPADKTDAMHLAGTDPLAAALRSDATGVRGVSAPNGKTSAVGPGTLLWSEAADSGWHASANGAPLPRRDAFGWTNAFTLDRNASVAVHYDGGFLHSFARVVEVGIWIVAVAAWVMTRRRRSRRRRERVVVLPT
jgi:GT2 family glycosyltransferase